ncbi:MAG TPA: hypothetical protein VGJ48_03690, partial [Pyrinomonadaceae bacterium]
MEPGKKAQGDAQANYSRKNSSGLEDNNSHNETQKWLDSMEYMLESALKNRTSEAPLLVERLIERLRDSGLKVPSIVNTPYINTIPDEKEPPYPGDREIERRI